MRILIWHYVPPDPDSGYWFWLKSGMEAVGHQVISIDCYALMAVFGQQGMQRLLLRYAEAYRIQAVVVTPQNQVEPTVLTQMRQMGIAVIAFRYDDCLVAAPGRQRIAAGNWRQFRLYDAYCDLAVTVCQGMVTQAAERDGNPPTYLPLPFGWQTVVATPGPLRPVIAFCGSPKYNGESALSWRVQVVRHLLAHGLPVELHHDSWAAVPGCEAVARPTPSLPAMFETFRTATVNLALASDWSTEPHPAIKLMNVEIAAAGGMQIASPCPELADLFSCDRDVATAETPEEIALLARHFLAHPAEAGALGQNSRRAMERLGGWDRWWDAVAAHLAGKGIVLPLDGSPQSPDPAIAPELAMANLALAHLYEGANKPVQAKSYFQEASQLAPTEYHAHAGLARLSGEAPTAMHHWRQAASHIALTQAVALPVSFSVASVGTAVAPNQVKAAIRWVEHAIRAEDWGELIAAMTLVVPNHPGVAGQVCAELLRRRQGALAEQIAALHNRAWPESTLVLVDA